MKRAIVNAFRWVVMIPASVSIVTIVALILGKISFLPDWVSMSVLGAAFVVPAQLIAPCRKDLIGAVAAWVVVAVGVGLIVYRAVNGPDLNFFGWVAYLWGVLLLCIAGFMFKFDGDPTASQSTKAKG
jgi:hypothetical protein